VQPESEAQRVPQMPALQRALAEAKPAELDAATVALAQRYAQLLDDAAAADKYRRPIERLDETIASATADMSIVAAEQVEQAWSKIKSALAEHSVASDLGPKLLAALQQLGLTPASRASKPTGSGPAPERLKTPLQLIRDETRERGRGGSRAG